MFDESQQTFRELAGIVAERTNRLVIWCGAGLSAPVHIPTWMKLRENICIGIENNARSLEEGSDRDRKLSTCKLARSHQDMWLSFQLLEEEEASTYRSIIRQSLSPADKCAIPPTYQQIWRLPLRGLLTTNIDKLASRAFAAELGGKPVHEFHGIDSGKYVHILRGTIPFIVNLHGIAADYDSWVFTRDKLKDLTGNHGYRHFIETCLSTHTVIYLGITVDDIAVGGFLESLKRLNVDFGQHYWVTDRSDIKTDKWAQSQNIRIIRYQSAGQDHDALDQMIDRLLSHVTKEDTPVPTVFYRKSSDLDILPEPYDVANLVQPEKIRQVLNKHAAAILDENSPSAYSRYAEFCEKYEYPIEMAWHVAIKEPMNILLGYKVTDRIAKGAFGQVYRAIAPDGRVVAIKVLHREIRSQPEHLQSFRRGVRAMKILSSHHVEGIVPYLATSEIPAMAVMEFIEGPNLEEAVRNRYINDWHDILQVSLDLTKIIRRAHRVTERVFHRDIRPANIMLKGGYVNQNPWDVVVLDFDLAWHMGSSEKSVLVESRSGYLAPEQVSLIPNVSTRNAAVDSYGLGMTLFFLRTGEDPPYLHSMHKNREENIRNKIRAFNFPQWHSLAARYARLIERSTYYKQSDRLDLSEIQGELEQLSDAVNFSDAVKSSELVAEELISRTAEEFGPKDIYDWDPDHATGKITTQSGVMCSVAGWEVGNNVRIEFNWASTGDKKYKTVRKYLPTVCEKCISSLKYHGWIVDVSPAMRAESLFFSLRAPTQRVLQNLQSSSKVLASHLRDMQFQ